ncbi:hypothetical protein UlMin_037666 [Ulmus minor]
MGFENLKPIFGEPKVEGAGEHPRRFLFHVHASDPSHLTIHVTDFYNSTWEATRSVLQLEDMRDSIGIGGSWSEFVDYVMASINSKDVKLVLEGDSHSDSGAAFAKLVGQKSKGMPVISISLTKLLGSAAASAVANFSLELFKAFNSIRELHAEEKDRVIQLTKVVSAEREKNQSIQSELEQYTKRHKSQKMNSVDKPGVSSPLKNSLQSPEKPAAQDAGPTKVANRVVPAYRRAKVRGALLQDTDDSDDNKQ